MKKRNQTKNTTADINQERPSLQEILFLKALNSSYRLLVNYGARRIKELDVTMAQAYMLLFLAYHPDMTLEEISKELLLAKSAIHLTLHQLVKGGYLEKVPDLHDKRMFHFKMLEKGFALLPIFYKTIRDMNNRALSVLTDDEQKTFLSLLDKVNQQIKAEYKDK
ncbi:MAG: winged helix-turn-helix transcriptional regulator [Victivallales bacterium]|nr:winged helix-turn-helix transcriptional regulator [Victivallales bacterium]